MHSHSERKVGAVGAGSRVRLRPVRHTPSLGDKHRRKRVSVNPVRSVRNAKCYPAYALMRPNYRQLKRSARGKILGDKNGYMGSLY